MESGGISAFSGYFVDLFIFFTDKKAKDVDCMILLSSVTQLHLSLFFFLLLLLMIIMDILTIMIILFLLLL